MPAAIMIQRAALFLLNILVAVITGLHCRRWPRAGNDTKEYFLAGVPGLILLAKNFVPLYYKYNCATVTKTLERRYNSKHIRATVAAIFLPSSVLLFLPVMFYIRSLVLRTMFGLDVPLLVPAAGGPSPYPTLTAGLSCWGWPCSLPCWL